MSRLLLFGFKHPAVMLLGVLLLTLLAAPRAGRVRLDLSADNLVAPGSPERRAFDEMRARFSEDEVAIVYVEDPALLTPSKLARLRALHDALAALPFVRHVESLCSIRDVREIDGAIELEPIVGTVPPATPAAMAEKREQILSHPILRRNVVSTDGTATMLALHLQPEAAAPPEMARTIDTIIAPFSRHFVTVFQLGAPAVQAEIAGTLRRDLLRLVPLACGILFIVLTILLRSALGAALPILQAAIGVCWTLATMAALGLPLTLLNSMLPILILVIGAAEDTHLIHEFLAALRHEPNPRTAFHATARRIGLAMTLTIVTTLLGFASTALTDLPIVRNFGICAVIGLASRFLLSLLFLPALLRIFTAHFARIAKRESRDKESEGLAAWIVAHALPKARLVVAILAIVSGFSLLAASQIELSNDLLSFLDRDAPVVRHTKHAAAKLAGLKTISLEIDGKPESFLQPRELTRLRELCQKIATLPGVDSVTSFADTVARLHQQFHGGAAEDYRVPGSSAAVRQMLLFVDASEFSGQVAADYSAVHVRIRTSVEESTALNRLVEAIRDLMRTSDFAGQPSVVTGGAVVGAAAVDAITKAQVFSLGSTTVLMFIIVAALFLSLRCGALNLVVNLFAIVVIFGVMGAAGIPLNAGTCMVAAITLGIAVDDTLHLLVRFNREMGRLRNERRGIEATLRAEIRPIVAATVAIAGGFAVLALSGIQPVRQFGALSAGVLLVAMATDLFVTPVLFANIRLITLWDVLGLKLRRSLIEHSHFFRGLNGWQAKTVILASNVEKFRGGEAIVREGEMGETMYVIIVGEVEVWVEQPAGRRSLARLGVGDIFGEVALVCAGRRTANVSAATETSVLALDQHSLRSFRRFSPYLAAHLFLNIANILGERLVQAIDKPAAPPPPAPSPAQ